MDLEPQPPVPGQQPTWQQPQDAVWPPQPAVWPPPPGNTPDAPVFFPFKFLYEKVDGTIADFREGSLGVGSAGLTISGRVQPRAEIYQTVLLVTFVFCRLGALIAHFIMRYGCLRPEVCQVPWNLVHSITTVPSKNKLCVVYTAPNYAGTMKIFSLAMRFTPDMFAPLIQATSQHAPGLAQPGRLKSGTSIVLIVLLVLLIAVIAIGAMKFLGSSASTTSYPTYP